LESVPDVAAVGSERAVIDLAAHRRRRQA
jgi:hypothetical protein